MLDILLLVFIGAGLGATATSYFIGFFFLRPLRHQLRGALSRLELAKRDTKIVEALRAGDLDPADLRELDLAPATRDWNLPKGTTNYSLHALPAKLTPRFVPSLYRQHPEVRDLVPGDEVWVDYNVIYILNGHPVADSSRGTFLAEERGPIRCIRLRVYEDGSLEMGLEPGTLISSHNPGGKSRPIHRICDLDTGNVVEVDRGSRND